MALEKENNYFLQTNNKYDHSIKKNNFFLNKADTYLQQHCHTTLNLYPKTLDAMKMVQSFHNAKFQNARREKSGGNNVKITISIFKFNNTKKLNNNNKKYYYLKIICFEK